MKAFRSFIRFMFCKSLFRVKYEGTENVDESKNYLVVANHERWADPFFIWSGVKDLSIMAKEELFKIKPIGDTFKRLGVFPIARGKKDFGHVLQAVKILKNKRSLLIFPEGTRKARTKGIKAKNGAIFIAKEADAYVLPIHITENYRLFGKVVIEFKKPIKVDIAKEDIKNKEVLSKETERVMDIIYNG